MFATSVNDYIYNKFINTPIDENLVLPLELDTEYTHPKYDINNPTQDICTNLTVQCRGINDETGIIYSHPENKKPRHRVYRHGFVGIDYLQDKGFDVELKRLPSWDTSVDVPWIQFDIFSFFAIAELLRVFQGVYANDILTLISSPSNNGIEQGRRLRTYTKEGNRLHNWVEMPWLLTINGITYRVRIVIYDTCAVHGVASYSTFCSNSGVELKYKDNFTNFEKSIMDVMYNERPEDFDNYALGDLHNHDALIGNAKKFQEIYETLGLSEYYTIPRLTIGATVARLFESSIKNLFKSDPSSRDVINIFCKYGSADHLKRKSTTTACLNAKVDGGRCRNNRPTDTTIKGVICDIDISGCYGEGLRAQTYPLGNPMVLDYPINSKNNKYNNLRQFLTKYRKQLVPGLWQARVSLKEGYTLKYKQDILASWYPPKDLSKLPTDTEFCETDQWWTIDNVGEIKVLTNEVNHAVITHDFIQWLENVASKRQREELLDNLIVETAIYYPACDRVNSIEELLQAYAEHGGYNTTEGLHPKRRSRKVSIEEECYKWYGVNLGELLIDKLLIERKKHPKKTPFNELYKLCINTVYGDMVSPFFTVGNVVVGNNITARARTLAWCMEKGLHGWQTITDGCAFDINNVVYPRQGRDVNGENTVDIYTGSNSYNYTLKPLVDKNDLSVTLNLEGHKLRTVESQYNDNVVYLPAINNMSPDESLAWVNRAAMTHLQKLFPGLDVLWQLTNSVKNEIRIGQFEFEAKGFYDTATFHGTANYSLSFNGVDKFAMRSYSRRNNKIVVLADDLQVIENGEKPSERFLLALRNPKKINRGQVYLRERVLKVGDFRRNFRVWKDTLVYPGCTVEMPALLHEFSLSQFTFQTYEQYCSWRKEYERLLRGYGQSYEMFFIEDDCLNYQEMVETIDKAIRAGRKSLFDGVDKRTTNFYRNYIQHQEAECLKQLRQQLEIRYHGKGIFGDRLGGDDDMDSGNDDYIDD